MIAINVIFNSKKETLGFEIIKIGRKIPSLFKSLGKKINKPSIHQFYSLKESKYPV